jgi:hypothetical protein
MRLTDEELARELRLERPEPDPEFADALDRWAAQGFPRGGPDIAGGRRLFGDRAGGRLAELRTRMAGVPARRLLLPVLPALPLLLIIGLVISLSGEMQSGGGDDSGGSGSAFLEEPSGDDRAGATGQAGGAERAFEGGAEKAAPTTADQAAQAEGLVDELGNDGRRTARAADGSPPRKNREIARTADLVLATEPDQIRSVADGVNGVVNQFRGYVISSSVQSGDAKGELGARFRMRLPAGTLQESLAALSELAHVESRTEGTLDITGRFISAQERIDENEARRQSLLNQLEQAVTQTEIDAIRAQLRTVSRQLSGARRDLARAQQRVQLVPVTVSIVSDPDADAADDEGSWGVDDAIDDAGDVLSAAAGVALITGAVLAPLALIALIVALAWRLAVRRGRNRALDTAD